MNTQMQKEFDRLEHAIGDGDPQTLRKAVDDLRGAMSVLSSANNTQVGGQHYKVKTIQPWDYIAANGQLCFAVTQKTLDTFLSRATL